MKEGERVGGDGREERGEVKSKDPSNVSSWFWESSESGHSSKVVRSEEKESIKLEGFESTPRGEKGVELDLVGVVVLEEEVRRRVPI